MKPMLIVVAFALHVGLVRTAYLEHVTVRAAFAWTVVYAILQLRHMRQQQHRRQHRRQRQRQYRRMRQLLSLHQCQLRHQRWRRRLRRPRHPRLHQQLCRQLPRRMCRHQYPRLPLQRDRRPRISSAALQLKAVPSSLIQLIKRETSTRTPCSTRPFSSRQIRGGNWSSMITQDQSGSCEC